MFVNSDFTDLLKLFNANRVRYLVVGGYALIQYAEPRFTKDLDLWISTDTSNAKAFYKALHEFGAPLAGLTVADFTQEGCYYQMGASPVRVDILMGLPGGNGGSKKSFPFYSNYFNEQNTPIKHSSSERLLHAMLGAYLFVQCLHINRKIDGGNCP